MDPLVATLRQVNANALRSYGESIQIVRRPTTSGGTATTQTVTAIPEYDAGKTSNALHAEGAANVNEARQYTFVVAWDTDVLEGLDTIPYDGFEHIVQQVNTAYHAGQAVGKRAITARVRGSE